MMRYMDVEGTHIRSIDHGKYKHNNKGLCEKFNFIFSKSINREGTTITKVAMHTLWETLLSLLFFLMIRSVLRGDQSIQQLCGYH